MIDGMLSQNFYYKISGACVCVWCVHVCVCVGGGGGGEGGHEGGGGGVMIYSFD